MLDPQGFSPQRDLYFPRPGICIFSVLDISGDLYRPAELAEPTFGLLCLRKEVKISNVATIAHASCEATLYNSRQPSYHSGRMKITRINKKKAIRVAVNPPLRPAR